MKKPAHNKDRVEGQKAVLTEGQIRMIKDHLSEKADAGNLKSLRDLTLFSIALDSMLRASDLLQLTVGDFQGVGGIKTRITLKQQKTGKRHMVEISTTTKSILESWIKSSQKIGGEFLFTDVLHMPVDQRPISRVQYSKLVKAWVKWILGIDDVRAYSTHSLRRTKAALVYEKTQNIEAVRQLLGQSSVTATSHYLNVSKENALDLAREIIHI